LGLPRWKKKKGKVKALQPHPGGDKASIEKQKEEITNEGQAHFVLVLLSKRNDTTSKSRGWGSGGVCKSRKHLGEGIRFSSSAIKGNKDTKADRRRSSVESERLKEGSLR